MSALSTITALVIAGRPTAVHMGPTDRPTPSTDRSSSESAATGRSLTPMSTGATKRDRDATRLVLETWLASRLGGSAVTVSDMSLPKAGFSNETIFGKAAWTDADGTARERG